MSRGALPLLMSILSASLVFAVEPDDTAPARRITLQEAVQLALKHNHQVRLAGYTVEEKQHAKDAAKSEYFPSIHAQGDFVHVTDTQLIQITAGSLGVVAGTPIPPVTQIINQGGLDLPSFGIQLTQPLTTLLKIKRQNDMAQAELKASREKAQLTGNNVALTVHQVYYQILIAQAHRRATEARITASQQLQGERVEQVRFGSVLEQDLIDSRTHFLQARQELLTTDLQLSDLRLRLNDLMGLPLTTSLELDPAAATPQELCQRKDCVTAAMASHPEIIEARDEVEKAAAAVSFARADLRVPDVYVFAHYRYQDNLPFLARNFGTFGFQLNYDLFDAGHKWAVLREREVQLAAAKEDLARLTDDVEVAVQTAYNKLERTQQMLKVAEEVMDLRTEQNRVMHQKLLRGAALSSQAETATAEEYDARTLLLQSRLDYLEAHDELVHAMGRTP